MGCRGCRADLRASMVGGGQPDGRMRMLGGGFAVMMGQVARGYTVDREMVARRSEARLEVRIGRIQEAACELLNKLTAIP
jgi:hypothetical protein